MFSLFYKKIKSNFFYDFLVSGNQTKTRLFPKSIIMKNTNKFLILFTAGILLYFFLGRWGFPIPGSPGRLHAQNPQEIPEQNQGTAPAEMNDAEYLAEAGKFRLGGDPTFWVLTILFNFALGVTLERIWVYRRDKANNSALVDLLSQNLNQMPLDESRLEELSANPGKNFGMEGRIASVSLKGWNNSMDAMREFATAAILAEKRALEKRLVVLSTLGNNTPFIGLLGTVLGIMKAFRDLALAGDAGPAGVMKGISEALVATAMGLGVAIPCVIAFNALNKIVEDRLSAAEEIATLLRAMKLTKENPTG